MLYVYKSLNFVSNMPYSRVFDDILMHSYRLMKGILGRKVRKAAKKVEKRVEKRTKAREKVKERRKKT